MVSGNEKKHARQTKQVSEESSNMLTGMRMISAYTRLSEATILDLIANADFPARKTKGADGIWISNASSIDRWSQQFSEARN